MMCRGVEIESSVEVVCDVAVAGEVHDEACGGVLDELQPLLAFGHGSCMEGIAVVVFVVGGSWSSSESGRPPGVIPCGGGGAKDEYFHLVEIEFEAAALHPFGDGLHSFVEVGLGRVVGEGEDQLGVVGVQDDVEVVGLGDVSKRGHVDVEEGRAEGRTLGYATDDFGGLRAEWGEADSLGSAGEKGGDPVQGSVVDSSIAEV
ncbi:hypothetical protein NDU88_000509 [Pleurodeles waltl]|uniref:Uncharacterized protein n=1 Tax=Pleurodeles waltl TaxID=8319 RepID=A0AAV7V952_PLEWA|nr:hypothetical protein NDU88_000509 [Pleurodeles waltl]